MLFHWLSNVHLREMQVQTKHNTKKLQKKGKLCPAQVVSCFSSSNQKAHQKCGCYITHRIKTNKIFQGEKLVFGNSCLHNIDIQKRNLHNNLKSNKVRYWPELQNQNAKNQKNI